MNPPSKETTILKSILTGKPLLVVVKDGRWDAYAQNNPPTVRDQLLLKLIYGAGGVNENCTPGRYLFNAKWRPFRKQNYQMTLTKIQE